MRSAIRKAFAASVRNIAPLPPRQPPIPTLPRATTLIKPVYVTLAEPLAPKEAQQPSVVVLDPTVFNHPMRNDILHLCITHYRDSLRQGTASTKTRSEVAGSGRKLHRQKGTGRARVGDGQSPIRRGGGIAFGPKPRDFSTKLPRKVIEMGMRVGLSAKLKENRLGVMQTIDWESGKTKSLARRISTLGLAKTLFITGSDKVPEGIRRASGNIPLVSVVPVSELDVYSILRWDRLMLDVQAVQYLEDKLRKPVELVETPLIA